MHDIDIIDDLLHIMDTDGNGCDTVALSTYRAAKRTIRRWAATYTIDVADAYRKIETYFAHPN